MLNKNKVKENHTPNVCSDSILCEIPLQSQWPLKDVRKHFMYVNVHENDMLYEATCCFSSLLSMCG